MKLTKATQLTLEGRGVITVNPIDHVITGGEGSVFRVGNTILKIYTDPSKMVADDMPAKVRALSALSHPGIIAPRGIITASSPIGFYMDYVEGNVLTPFFDSNFRNQNGINEDRIMAIVQGMKEIYEYAHSKGAVLVDANELNWIITPDLLPKVIDVDSWAIGKWPQKAVMDSIRDWHSKEFNELTDWFSWAVVTFQLFTGIHPYKGSLAGFRRGAMVDRMKANASVFSSGIRLNNSVRDFRSIPESLRVWYKEVFQDGRRSEPPLNFGGVVVVPVMQVVNVSSQKLIHAVVFDAKCIVKLFYCGVGLTSSGELVELRSGRVIYKDHLKNVNVVFTNGGWLVSNDYEFIWIDGVSLQEHKFSITTAFHSVLVYKNRMFIVTQQGLTELSLIVFSKPILSTGSSWSTLPNATRWFRGCGISDVMGATFLTLPFGEKACATVKVKELDGMRSVAAYLGDCFFSCVSVNKSGDYIKSELSFSSDYRTYRYWEGATDMPSLNTAVLQRGVCSTITEDGVLNLFAVKSPEKVMKITDASIELGMNLVNMKEEIYYLKNGTVYSLKTSF